MALLPAGSPARPYGALAVSWILGGVLLLFILLPLLALTAGQTPAGLAQVATSRDVLDAIGLSLAGAVLAAVSAVLFGVPLGYVLARGRLPFKRFLIGLVFLPMVVPGLAGGILLLLTFGPYGTVGGPLEGWNVALTGNLAGIVLAQLYVSSPFVIISALTAFSSIDPKLEMAAAILGDSPWHIFWRISLPLAWPGIAAGITLAWIRALGEFGATMIVAYNPHTLPVYLWAQFEANGLPGALPVAFLLVLLAASAVALSSLLGRLKSEESAAAVPGGVPGRLA